MDSAVATGVTTAFTSVQTQVIALIVLALPYLIAITVLIVGASMALALVYKVRGLFGRGRA
jgi:hypothetical protein